MQVAIKLFRVHLLESQEAAKLIRREMKYPALVSQCMNNGNSMFYLREHPETNIHRLATGVASGLTFLHQRDVIHSDLKSDNTPVSEDGEPLLADFGISRFMSSTQTFGGASTDIRGSVRWMAVELLSIAPQESETSYPSFHSKESDVWAYGMVLYELLSGKRPYHLFTQDLQVTLAIIHGYIPRPTSELDSTERQQLWTICLKCWAQIPSHRPTMQQILNGLTSTSEERTSAEPDEDELASKCMFSCRFGP